MELKKEISRKKFFTLVGITSVLAFAVSSFPSKLIRSVVKNSNKKHVKISIHPSAVKRTTKV